jgi:hypothetical protein
LEVDGKARRFGASNRSTHFRKSTRRSAYRAPPGKKILSKNGNAKLASVGGTAGCQRRSPARDARRQESTTKTYLHLAGVVFRDEAAALEERLLGSRTFYQSQESSDDSSKAEASEHAA